MRKTFPFLSSSFFVITLLILFLSTDVINYTVFYISMIGANIFMAGAMMATNIPLNTALIKIIDPEYRGRVFGVISSISGGAVPIAVFLGGVLMSYTSVAVLGVTCSLLLLVPTIGFLINPKVSRMLDDMDDEGAAVQEIMPEN